MLRIEKTVDQWSNKGGSRRSGSPHCWKIRIEGPRKGLLTRKQNRLPESFFIIRLLLLIVLFDKINYFTSHVQRCQTFVSNKSLIHHENARIPYTKIHESWTTHFGMTCIIRGRSKSIHRTTFAKMFKVSLQ